MKLRERLFSDPTTNVDATSGISHGADDPKVTVLVKSQEKVTPNTEEGTVKSCISELLDYQQQTSDDYDPVVAWGLLESIKQWQDAAPEWRVNHVAAAIQAEVDYVSTSWKQVEDSGVVSTQGNEIIIRARMIDELLAYLDMALVTIDEVALKQSHLPKRLKEILRSTTTADNLQETHCRKLKVWPKKQLAAIGLSVAALTSLGMTQQAFAMTPPSSLTVNLTGLSASIDSLLGNPLPMIEAPGSAQQQALEQNQAIENKQNGPANQEQYSNQIAKYAEAIVYLQNNDGVGGDDLNGVSDTMGGLSATEWATIFVDAANEYGGGVVTPELLIAQVKQESGFKPGAVSYAAAKGPCQFIDGTWSTWGRGGNVFDPHDCIPAQARYMSYIYNNYVKATYSDPTLARKMTEAGYNGGERSIARYGTALLTGTLPGYEQTGPYTTLIEKSIGILQQSLNLSSAQNTPTPAPAPARSSGSCSRSGTPARTSASRRISTRPGSAPATLR